MNSFLDLRDDLETLLAGELGQYKFPDGTTENAIWVMPPQVPSDVSIVPGSGIECLLSKSPQQSVKNLAGGHKLNCQTWQVILRQHNFSGTTADAVQTIGEAFTASRAVIREQFETDGSIEPEQARILIPVWKLLTINS